MSTHPIQAMTDPIEIANDLEKAFNEDCVDEIIRLSWLAKEALRALAARPVTPAPIAQPIAQIADPIAQAASAPEALSDDLRRKLAALPRRQLESAPGVYESWVHQGSMLDAIDEARAALAAPSTPAALKESK